MSSCKTIHTCKTCQQKHSTVLHGYIPKSKIDLNYSRKIDSPRPNPPVSSTTITSQSVPITSPLVSGESTVSMCIVPVILSHPSSKPLLETFCSDYIEIYITIKTINGCCSEDVKKVEGLLVKNLKSNTWLTLSYTREDFDIEDNIKFSSESLEKWSYLNEVSDLVSDSLHGKVGILIGSNCPKLIEPLSIIPSENEGPYAFETRLGCRSFKFWFYSKL